MTNCSSHADTWPPEDSERARHDAALYQRIAVLEQQARSLEVEIVRREQAEAALLKARQVLTSVERTAHLGSWEFDENTEELHCSDELFRICGLLPQSLTMSLDIA